MDHLYLNIVMHSIHYFNVIFCLLLNLGSLSCISESILPDLVAKSVSRIVLRLFYAVLFSMGMLHVS